MRLIGLFIILFAGLSAHAQTCRVDDISRLGQSRDIRYLSCHDCQQFRGTVCLESCNFSNQWKCQVGYVNGASSLTSLYDAYGATSTEACTNALNKCETEGVECSGLLARETNLEGFEIERRLCD